MPLTSEDIMRRLRQAGYQALIVGGYVRDSLLGEPAQDADLATNASPEACLKIFSDARLDLTGQRFRVLRVDGYELASFRGERYAIPGKPEVWQADSFTADAARRDFTINAMAFTLEGDLLDPYGGQADLQAKLVRAVGNATARFEEDPVRLLRGAGLAVRLNFSIEAQTAEAMRKAAHLLKELPGERIAREVGRLIEYNVLAPGMRLYQELGFLAYIFPELMHLPGLAQRSPHHYLDVWEHTLQTVQKIGELQPQDRVLSWAALFHDCGKGLPLGCAVTEDGLLQKVQHETESARRFREAATRLALGHKLISEAGFYIRWHMPRRIEEPGAAVRYLNLLAREWSSKEELTRAVEKLQFLLTADAYGKRPALLEQHLKQVDEVRKLLTQALRRVPYYCKEAGLSGGILKGCVEERKIGCILRRQLLAVQSEHVQEWYDEIIPRGLPPRSPLPKGAVLRLAGEADVPRLQVLINTAYKELGDMGFNFSGVTQDEAETLQSLAGKEVWVIEEGQRLIATVAFSEDPPNIELGMSETAWYISRFCVDPARKRQGLGSFLAHHAFDRAREQGYRVLRLDTAVPAHYLVRFYRSFGFRVQELVQWCGKLYPSFIMEAPVN